MAEHQNTLPLGQVDPASVDVTVPAQSVQVPAQTVQVAASQVSVDVPPVVLPAIPYGPAVQDGIVLAAGDNFLDAKSKPYAEFLVSHGVNCAVKFTTAGLLPFATIAVYVKRTAAGGLIWDSRVKPAKNEPYPQPGADIGAWTSFVFKVIPDGGGLVLLNQSARAFAP